MNGKSVASAVSGLVGLALVFVALALASAFQRIPGVAPLGAAMLTLGTLVLLPAAAIVFSQSASHDGQLAGGNALPLKLAAVGKGLGIVGIGVPVVLALVLGIATLVWPGAHIGPSSPPVVPEPDMIRADNNGHLTTATLRPAHCGGTSVTWTSTGGETWVTHSDRSVADTAFILTHSSLQRAVPTVRVEQPGRLDVFPLICAGFRQGPSSRSSPSPTASA